jgi:hypothetical protein
VVEQDRDVAREALGVAIGAIVVTAMPAVAARRPG